MKSVITVIIMCAAAVCAPAATKKKAAPAPQVLTIPKDAVPNPDGVSYSYKDKQGKKWTYTKTPFGVMKAPAADPSAAPPPPDLSSTKAVDNGETVRFERASPFGTTSWEKKKSELTDDERRILEAQTAKTEQK